MARRKEVDYFGLFKKAIDYSCVLTKELTTLVEEYKDINKNGQLEKRVDEIHKIEHDADKVYHEIVFELNRAFITPIEREDILLIANAIDDVSDKIEEVAFSFWVFNITEMRPETKQFIDLVNRICKESTEAVYEFANYRKSKTIKDKLHTIKKLENEGDTLYRHSVRRLFENEKDPIALQKWREIYDNMEKIFDACRYLANMLENTIVKNS
ncbi:MAG TPA: DUF47 domain-containing protein [Clostridiaceae bacterium]|jgi:predicted phosphate transport protein (TIGR00153 family)|nr:DUF47 domain-containing protein [Clostridiaceae bacterium]